MIQGTPKQGDVIIGEVFGITKEANYQRGYKEGYNNGYEDGGTFSYEEGHKDGYNRGYNIGVTDGRNEGYSTGYNEGKAEGVEMGYNEGYNTGYSEADSKNYLRLCNRPNFPGLGVFDTEDLVLNFDVAYTADKLVHTDWGAPCYDNTAVKHLTVNFAQKLLSTWQMFAYSATSDTVLERVTINADLSQSTNFQQLFSHWSALKVVDGTPLDLSSATKVGVIANVCYALEEIRFAPNSIKTAISFVSNGNLSEATVRSIVDGLADLTGKETQTLTVHPNVGTIFQHTGLEYDVIALKNWTLVY